MLRVKNWYSCGFSWQILGVAGSVLELVGLVSVYLNWARLQAWAANFYRVAVFLIIWADLSIPEIHFAEIFRCHEIIPAYSSCVSFVLPTHWSVHFAETSSKTSQIWSKGWDDTLSLSPPLCPPPPPTSPPPDIRFKYECQILFLAYSKETKW